MQDEVIEGTGTPVEVEGPPPAEEAPLDAVIVVRENNEGNIETRVVLNGDVRPTEVETLLKLGLQGWQKQIGV